MTGRRRWPSTLRSLDWLGGSRRRPRRRAFHLHRGGRDAGGGPNVARQIAVRAELTAAARVGVHRYSFPAGKSAHVLIDLRTSMYDYPGKVLWSGLRLRAARRVT